MGRYSMPIVPMTPDLFDAMRYDWRTRLRMRPFVSERDFRSLWEVVYEDARVRCNRQATVRRRARGMRPRSIANAERMIETHAKAKLYDEMMALLEQKEAEA